MILKTTSLTENQTNQIRKLWDEEYPINLNGRFDILMNEATNIFHYLIQNESEEIMGWVVIFEKSNEKRFSIIVPRPFQGFGFGKQLIDKLKEDNESFYGWVIDHNRDLMQNGTHYKTPLEFYMKLGFEVLTDVRVETEILSAVKIRWSKNVSITIN